jgi:copper chaperone
MQEVHIKIAGMTCGGCVNSVTRALNSAAGVEKVDVSLTNEEAIVSFDPEITSVPALQAAIIASGYSVEESAPVSH